MTSDQACRLRQAIDNHYTQLLELSDPNKVRLTYSVGGQSVSWTEYKKYLTESIAELERMLRDAGHDGPPGGIIVTTAG